GQGDIDCDGVIGLLDLMRLRNALTPAPSPQAAAGAIQIARPVASKRLIIGSGQAGNSTRSQIARSDQPMSIQPLSASRRPRATVLRAHRHAQAHDRAMDDLFGG
ncbi:MAG: hypothetical protein WD176_04205, partial [Pirellulales bacterium]